MLIESTPHTTIYFDDGSQSVKLLDQTLLPWQLKFLSITAVDDIAYAISSMQVRGAPAIGVAAAFGLYLQCLTDASDAALNSAHETLFNTRPTAVNLAWALTRMMTCLLPLDENKRAAAALAEAQRIRGEDIATNKAIADVGFDIIAQIAASKPAGEAVNILTHCNAGWLATVDWGTALAPIYKAKRAGINVHVWVDETRPRNQGALLSAFELGQEGVDHTLISDNSGGYLMQQGQVDLCIVGSDRTCANGDVCNKIGTYLKALAAKAHDVPFYVALPSSTIDWQMSSGADIPIEYRDESEVLQVVGRYQQQCVTVDIAPENTKALNPAFDVTPNYLVSGLITEHGLFNANSQALEILKNQLSAD